MSWASLLTDIISNLVRIEEAIPDIKSAIESKGITVPANALIDDYAGLILSIQTGGGSGDPGGGGGAGTFLMGEIPYEQISAYNDVVMTNIPSNPKAVLLFHNNQKGYVIDKNLIGFAFYFRFTESNFGGGIVSANPAYYYIDNQLYDWEYSPQAKTLTLYISDAFGFWGNWPNTSIYYAICL